MCNLFFSRKQFLKRFFLVSCLFFHFKTVEFLKFYTHVRFRKLDKITNWEEKCSDQGPCEFEFLGIIMSLFLYFGALIWFLPCVLEGGLW